MSLANYRQSIRNGRAYLLLRYASLMARRNTRIVSLFDFTEAEGLPTDQTDGDPLMIALADIDES